MKENEYNNFRQLFNDEKQNQFDEQGVLKQLEESLRKTRAAIQQFKGAKNDRVTIYGRYTSAILNEIQRQAQRFKQLPIGPVGKRHSSISNRENPFSFCVLKANTFDLLIIDGQLRLNKPSAMSYRLIFARVEKMNEFSWKSSRDVFHRKTWTIDRVLLVNICSHVHFYHSLLDFLLVMRFHSQIYPKLRVRPYEFSFPMRHID